MIRILLADDSSFMRKLLKDLVEQCPGFEVVGEANNGQEAIDKYKEIMPDLVILDVNMDKVGGIAALREIRAFNPKAKVIMCSSLSSEYMISESIQEGAKDFIRKPYFEDINNTLKRVVEQ